MTRQLDEALVEALADATRRGTGWVMIRRITTEQLRLARIDPALVVVLDDPTTYADHLRGSALALPCDYCAADPGEPCSSVSGVRLSTFHVARSGPVYDAWRLGHRDGLVDAFRRLVNDWDTPAADLLKKHEASW